MLKSEYALFNTALLKTVIELHPQASKQIFNLISKKNKSQNKIQINRQYDATDIGLTEMDGVFKLGEKKPKIKTKLEIK